MVEVVEVGAGVVEVCVGVVVAGVFAVPVVPGVVCVPVVVEPGDEELELVEVELIAAAKAVLDGTAMLRALRNPVTAVSNCWKSAEERALAVLSTRRSSSASTFKSGLVRRLRHEVPREAGACLGGCEPKN
jgi:hypothetical protein